MIVTYHFWCMPHLMWTWLVIPVRRAAFVAGWGCWMWLSDRVKKYRKGKVKEVILNVCVCLLLNWMKILHLKSCNFHNPEWKINTKAKSTSYKKQSPSVRGYQAGIHMWGVYVSLMLNMLLNRYTYCLFAINTLCCSFTD